MKFENLDEAVDHIIDHMSDNEKDMIKNADPAGIHMALASWVNTEYASNEKYNFKELVLKKLSNEGPSLQEHPDELIHTHNDNIVGIIIDNIIEKLHK